MNDVRLAVEKRIKRYEFRVPWAEENRNVELDASRYFETTVERTDEKHEASVLIQMRDGKVEQFDRFQYTGMRNGILNNYLTKEVLSVIDDFFHRN